MKIYTLEAKGEILAIFTHESNISYSEFREYCLSIEEETDSNDFYIMKDRLLSYDFKLVEMCGFHEVSKRKGAF